MQRQHLSAAADSQRQGVEIGGEEGGNGKEKPERRPLPRALPLTSGRVAAIQSLGVSLLSSYLPRTRVINCVFSKRANHSRNKRANSVRDKLNQVLRAIFFFSPSHQLTPRLAYIRGANLRALCSHKQGCSRKYTPNYVFKCSLETLVIMFYYWSPPQHNEL